MVKDPIDKLKVSTTIKTLLKSIRRDVRAIWAAEVKSLRCQARLDAKTIKLLERELELARLQNRLELTQ
jgi:hypothetical protein